MEYTIKTELNEECYRKFKRVVNQCGRTAEDLFKLFIIKTINGNGIDWLYTSIVGEVRTKNIKFKNAIELFRKKGYNLSKYNTSFASKNNRWDYYWINPDVRHLKEKWYIILNDNINNKLYLLKINPNDIEHLKMRNDRICNVAIKYNDENYLDIHSGIKFDKYLIDEIEYASLF